MNPIEPEHVYDLVKDGEPSISPDGAWLAYSRAVIDRKSMKERSKLILASIPGGEHRPLTQGDSDTAPRFSPDGRRIAFVRPDERGRKQLWIIPLDFGEARRITDVDGGVTDHAWSPDGARLAFVSDVRPEESTSEEPGPDVKVVRRIRYRSDAGGWRGDRFRHVFVVDVESGDARQVTSGEGDHAAPAWSPDGARIAYVSDAVEGRDTSWMAGGLRRVRGRGRAGAMGAGRVLLQPEPPVGRGGMVARRREAGHNRHGRPRAGRPEAVLPLRRGWRRRPQADRRRPLAGAARA